ncbi:MAG TPA: RNA polymerase sigma factor [Vicinamibacterales bacterium]|nr:RNA polymerase sigma factor [Vicinamibacterales bacterium]
MDSGTAGLLERARAGSAEALNLLYERCSPRLLAYIRLRLGRELRARLESRDILQASLLKSLQHIDVFKGDETRSLMGWLAKIAEHEIRDRADYHQRQRRDAAREVAVDDDLPLPAVARSALTQAILSEEAAQIERALEEVSPEHREVILLRKFEELSFKEIGARLGRSEDACRMLLARALTALTLALDRVAR